MTNQETQLAPVLPLVTAEKAVESWRKFEELKDKVLVDEDYQVIQDKRYIKRSGFRKIAVFFGLSDRILREERLDRASDGSFSWRIEVEAMAPNGRVSTGVGACDSKERKFAHVEHDVYATAHTRAKSRAISDMVAGGAVSAEEVESSPQEPAPPKLNGHAVEAIPTEAMATPQRKEEGKPTEYYYPKVEALEWKAFKEKRSAGSDEAGWIFSNNPGAEDLVGVVRRDGAIMVKMGNRTFLCKISGDEGQFLQRIPQE